MGRRGRSWRERGSGIDRVTKLAAHVLRRTRRVSPANGEGETVAAIAVRSHACSENRTTGVRRRHDENVVGEFRGGVGDWNGNLAAYGRSRGSRASAGQRGGPVRAARPEASWQSGRERRDVLRARGANDPLDDPGPRRSFSGGRARPRRGGENDGTRSGRQRPGAAAPESDRGRARHGKPRTGRWGTV